MQLASWLAGVAVGQNSKNWHCFHSTHSFRVSGRKHDTTKLTLWQSGRGKPQFVGFTGIRAHKFNILVWNYLFIFENSLCIFYFIFCFPSQKICSLQSFFFVKILEFAKIISLVSKLLTY
jgi:hypothetical protein